MDLLIIYSFLIITLGQRVFGQQPHDTCRNNELYIDDHIYPDDWHLIVDSYDYEVLFGANGVWELRDVDGDGIQWDDGNAGGACRLEIGVCTFETPNQNNWFFTDYNSYGNAVEVIVNATFRWAKCSVSTSCTNDFVTVYKYDTNGPVSVSMQVDTSRYTPITGNEMTSRLQQKQQHTGDTSVELHFDRPSGFSGLYLGFQDTGTCGQIVRFQVYYRIVPPVEDGFLFCPEVPLATGRTTSSTCTCAENSNTTESLERICSSDGVCSELPVCQCIPGYVFNQTGPKCQECPENTFKDGLSNNSVCRPCPANSNARDPASAKCTCVQPSIRNESRPGDNCTQPPSPPRLYFKQPTVDGTFVTVCWMNASRNGGLNDLHYNVYVSRLNRNENYIKKNDEGIFDNGNGDKEKSILGTLCYEVSGLDGKTSYSILVTSANGATGDPSELEQNLNSVDGQYLAIFVETGQAELDCNIHSFAGVRKSEAVVITFFITAIFFTIGVASITALLMWWFCLRNKHTSTPHGHSEKHDMNHKENAYTTKSNTSPNKRPPPPPRPPY